MNYKVQTPGVLELYFSHVMNSCEEPQTYCDLLRQMTSGTFDPFLAAYYFHFIAEYSELRKGRHQLVIPSKDKNIGKELSAATMQICNTKEPLKDS